MPYCALRSAVLIALLAVCVAGEATAEDPAAAKNPFGGFETWKLPNGVKVWYKHLPSDPQVSVSIVIPYGYDLDPPGQEQLAHFTEHMLFSDHLGRTEEQIKREIEDRGGVRNGITRADSTLYYARIGQEHGLFAVEWLYRVVSPHAMDPQIVERQREPVALEVRARERQAWDWIFAAYVDPVWLRLPGFWEREFALETRRTRDYYPYRSLKRITAEELSWFYDTYYVPSRMTLTIIGNLDREQVRPVVDATFGTLPVRQVPEVRDTLRDPGRYRQEISWADRSNVSYSRSFKLYRPTAREQLMLLFVKSHLDRRLDIRLRYGERKATYGLDVGAVQRGAAHYLSINGGIKDTEFEFARGVIDEELAALRDGTLTEEMFESARDAVASRWRTQNASAASLADWVSSRFYEPALHPDFPDMVGFAEGLTKGELVAFVRERFVPEREVLEITYRHPMSQGALGLAFVALVGLTVRGAKWVLVEPADMTRIRYVGRLRLPWVYKLAGIPLLIVLVAIGGRLLFHGYLALVLSFLLPVESFAVQWLVIALTLVVAVLATVVLLSRVPRKLLVFDDHVRIKYLVYRSDRWTRAEIAEVSLLRFLDVWGSRRLARCVPLTFGLVKPGIYLRHAKGRSYFFRVRTPQRLVELIEQVRTGAG